MNEDTIKLMQELTKAINHQIITAHELLYSVQSSELLSHDENGLLRNAIINIESLKEVRGI